jgi:hypothetical protein
MWKKFKKQCSTLLKNKQWKPNTSNSLNFGTQEPATTTEPDKKELKP